MSYKSNDHVRTMYSSNRKNIIKLYQYMIIDQINSNSMVTRREFWTFHHHNYSLYAVHEHGHRFHNHSMPFSGFVSVVRLLFTFSLPPASVASGTLHTNHIHTYASANLQYDMTSNNIDPPYICCKPSVMHAPLPADRSCKSPSLAVFSSPPNAFVSSICRLFVCGRTLIDHGQNYFH